MKLTVKGEEKEYMEGLTLAELVEIEKIEMPQYVTASVNDELLGASEFEGVVLKNGDVLEFIYFMGGGRL